LKERLFAAACLWMVASDLLSPGSSIRRIPCGELVVSRWYLVFSRKIQDRKFLMVFAGSAIIGFCGVDFVFEEAEILVLAVDSNGSGPFSLACVVGDAFVL
jgi:hypothetical protein